MNIKQQLNEIRKGLPKHIQWLLLFAAFLVVVILLSLLVSGGGDKNNSRKANKEVSLLISPSELDWTNVPVGKSRSQKIIISSELPAKISEVRLSKEIVGMTLVSACPNMPQIEGGLACDINLEWKPTEALDNTSVKLLVKYRAFGAPVEMENLAEVPIVISSKGEKLKAEQPKAGSPEPAPVLIVPPIGIIDPGTPPVTPPVEPGPPEPILPIVIPEPSEPVPAPPAPIIVPEPPVLPTPNPIEPPFIPEPPIELPALPAPIEDPVTEACYEFAFIGYDANGHQAGWIRASGGRYMFHPFSDKDCSKPTGEYNSETGIITDIKNPSKKIGSDAQRIGAAMNLSVAMPTLSNPSAAKSANRARQLLEGELPDSGGMSKKITKSEKPSNRIPSSLAGGQATVSSDPYDRTFVLRHFKPIPATIVNDVRAVAGNKLFPVQATVDRHVYSDNGRTIIVPAGTLMLGRVTGDMPGPYKAIGRIDIEWYRFVRPDGVEFNFTGDKPFSADSQGRVGVPGRGSTDYLEQMVMPLLTAMVPAAVNMIAPLSDKFVNQIDLDNNTVTQSGTVRSSELAKQEIIKSWNSVAQKLLIDTLDNTMPPFSIAAGTRITVYSPTDLIVAFGEFTGDEGVGPNRGYAKAEAQTITVGQVEPETMLGQARSHLEGTAHKFQDARMQQLMKGFDLYQGKQMAASNAYYNQLNQQGGILQKDGTVLKKTGTAEEQKLYNEQVLGLQYDEFGNIKNPNAPIAAQPQTPAALLCEDGSPPNAQGCCAGETLTEVEGQGMNCCPDVGGDCFPPIL
jgi:type IV secretory pathway VirB10-like protein